MTDVAKLEIRVDSSGVSTSRFELSRLGDTGERTSRRVTRASQRMRRGFSALQKSALGLGVGFGAATAGAIAIAERQSAAVKETSNLARALGISVGRLQEFEFAGNRVGLSAEKIGDVLKDVSDKIGDFAATGGGEAKDLFENLNLEIEALRGLRPDEQLLAIADAITQVNDRSQQIFYLESLADDASRLLPLLDNNAEALRRFSAEARQTGIALDDNDVRRMLEANRALRTFQNFTRGLSNDLTLALAPALRDSVSELDELRDIFRDSQFQRGVTALGTGMTFIAQEVARAVEDFGELQEILSRPWTAILEGFITGDYSRPGATGSYARGATGSFGEPDSLAPITVTADPLPERNALPPLPRALDFPTDPVDTGREDGLRHTRELIALEDQRLQQVKALQRALGSADDVAIMDFERRRDEIERYVKDSDLQTQLIAQNWDRLAADIGDSTGEMSQFAIQAQRNIQTQLGDTLAQTLKGDFDGILDSWTNLLFDMAAQAAAANLNQALFGQEFRNGGDLGGLIGAGVSALGGLFGGGTGQAVGINVGTVASGAANPVSLENLSGVGFGGFFANGGTLGAGQWGIAGEAGPEVISGPATVTPIAQDGNTSVRNEFNITYQEAEGKSQEERQSDQENFARQLRQQVASVMVEDVSNRGPISRSYQSTYGLKRKGAA